MVVITITMTDGASTHVTKPKKLAPETKARCELEAWLAADKRRSIAKLAAALSVSAPAVSQWLNRTARPDHDVRVLIQTVTGVHADGWETLDECRERLERAKLAEDARRDFDAQKGSAA
ncbi:MAG: hypothetical protein HOW73_47835 [Polyangiaceae bacterium]|nr:hypothetical protein [Polyangiaceae bacterium]